MPDTITFKLNDKPVRVETDSTRTLLWVLRSDLGLTGTKFGCGEGHCGSCTVLCGRRGQPLLPPQAEGCGKGKKS